jgi:MFS family permease
LIQFRLVQGTAAGVIQPLAQAILLDIYPQRDHGRMLAIWGAAIMAGPILGPVLGGVIADLRTCPEITESAFERVKYGFTTVWSYHMWWW